jgi:tripeptidyl-peptidase-1
VLSTSYGYNEADLSLRYAARQCAEYAKLGLLGVTVLYSSGDAGVAGNRGVCLQPDGALFIFIFTFRVRCVFGLRLRSLVGSQSREGRIFNPTFPSTCPYVTSIGATQLPTHAPGIPGAGARETACEVVIQSGGGFSNYFTRPQWQEEAVGRYVSEMGERGLLPEKGRWNEGRMRGYPDISANGWVGHCVLVRGH